MEPVFLTALLAAAIVVWISNSKKHPAQRTFPDEAEVERYWTSTYPAETVQAVILSAARNAALVESNRGSGLVCGVETQAICYALEPAGLRRLVEHPRGLRVEFANDAMPYSILDLTGAEVATWTAYLSRFIRQ